MTFLEMARAIFTVDEGKTNRAYRDTKGNWTIGIGHLIGSEIGQLKLSDHVVNEIFLEDFADALKDAEFVVGPRIFDSLTDARKIALVSMCFTLGREKFLKFDETIEAIKNYDWKTVHDNILASKWARDVDPKSRPGEGRDDRIAQMFLTGEFHLDYGLSYQK